jgi:phosphoribosyl-ATP pyrophosphohydrolase
VETVIAALAEDKPALLNESADLLYHLLVLLQCKDVTLAEVIAVLKQR